MGKVLKTLDFDECEKFTEDEWLFVAKVFHRELDDDFKEWAKINLVGVELEIKVGDSE